MNYRRTIGLAIFSCFLLAGLSCVSKKKYKELTSRYTSVDSARAALAKNYAALSKENAELQQSNAAEQLQLNKQLRELNDQLKTKLNDLESSNKKVAELQTAIQKQRNAQNELLSKVKNALVGFNPNELNAEIRSDGKVYVSLSEKLLFKSGSYKVDPKGKEALQKLAEVLIRQPDIDITIEGHTDSIPVKKGELLKDNLDLSVMRATSIERILTEEYAVNPKQMYASGRGENFPVASNKTEEGRASNRRTEIILSPHISELFKILEQQ